DEAMVFYPRGERPRRESYSVPDGEKHPALLLDFGGAFKVPETLGKEVSAEKFLELCTPFEDEEDEEDSEESPVDNAGENGRVDGNEQATNDENAVEA